MSWIRRAAELPVPEVAPRLGLLSMPGGSLGPCPACGASHRSRSERRGPVGIWDESRRWRCHRCGVEGDTPDLVSWRLAGGPLRDRSPELRGQVAEWFTGLSPARTWSTDRRDRRLRPQGLEAFWSSCGRVAADSAVSAWLRQRYGRPGGVDPVEVLERADLVRVLPESFSWPDWWPGTWGHWPLLLPLYEPDGQHVSFQARRITEGKPKTLSPRSHQVQGTFFANDKALGLMRKEDCPDLLVVVEGSTDFIMASLIAEIHSKNIAVLGGFSGSWKSIANVELSWNLPIYVATDRNDPDGTGDYYADLVSKALEGRRLWRMPLVAETSGVKLIKSLDFCDVVKSVEDFDSQLSASYDITFNLRQKASRLDQAAPTLSTLYGVEDLDRDRCRSLMSLATLPPWSGATKRRSDGPVYGHGWGDHLDRLLGGGIHPGYMLALGASAAGAGKTAWLMQVVDGLALRSAELLETGRPGPLTPVLILSEMSPAALTWRTLARWTGADSRTFRAGASAERLLDRSDAEELVERAFSDAREALQGPLEASRRFLRMFQSKKAGRPLLEETAQLVELWREELGRETGREIWPVLILDPVQRWQDPKKGEVEALNDLIESIGEFAHRKGREWIVFLTSDTNKGTAAGQTSGGVRQEAIAGFRGSYKLMHLVDSAIYLHRINELNQDSRRVVLETVLVKNRWGSTRGPWPHFQWTPWNGRFEPWTEAEAAVGIAGAGGEQEL